jgi:hypothetical protein
MVQEPYQQVQGRHRSRQGVICLFCGARVALHKPVARRASPADHVSLVWCRLCGREAPYRPAEIIELQDGPRALNFWGDGIRPI